MTVSEVRRHSVLRTLVRSWWIEQALPTGQATADAHSPALLLLTGLSEWRCPYQRLTRIRPAVRMRVLPIVRFQEGSQPLLELPRRGEVAPFQKTPRQDAEPQFHLVEPGAMLGREVKDVFVRR